MNYQIFVYFLCCTYSVLAHTIQKRELYESCFTPNRTNGQCINIRNCPVLLDLLAHRPLPAHTTEYLQKANCGFDGLDPHVCCAVDDGENNGHSTAAPTEKVPSGPVTSDLLPTIEQCGTFQENRIVGGKYAEIDEFPWMALIEYQKPNGRGFYCGGVLISHRYILTAAHCVKGKDLPKSWTLVSVRLGEYNTDTDPDCTKFLDIETCAHPAVNVPVTERIAHEDYDPNDISQLHDIALLRLGRDVEFGDYVKPICLATTEAIINKNYAGTNMTVAGWGKTENRSESNIKLKLDVPVQSNSDCARVYGAARVSLGTGQLCAGGIKGKDSCRGDSGGPLMTVEFDEGESNWYAAGVVSFGPSPCGLQDWPGVYTRVSEYIPWIISKLRP